MCREQPSSPPLPGPKPQKPNRHELLDPILRVVVESAASTKSPGTGRRWRWPRQAFAIGTDAANILGGSLWFILEHSNRRCRPRVALARDANHHLLTTVQGDLLMAMEGGRTQPADAADDRSDACALATTENSTE